MRGIRVSPHHWSILFWAVLLVAYGTKRIRNFVQVRETEPKPFMSQHDNDDAHSIEPSVKDASQPRLWPNSEETVELIREAQKGDVGARGDLLERHRHSLRRMIDMRLDLRIRARVDASDIVQDVLVTADRRLDAFFENPEVPFFIWLRKLAQDRIIDAHRRHRASAKRSVDREQPWAFRASNDESTILLANQLCDEGITPAAAATLDEFRKHFESALHRMDVTDREVIIMRHYEFMSNKDIALALGISEHAASMRYVRALRKVGKLLRKDGYDEA